MANEDQQNDSVGIAQERETNQVNEVNFVNRVESVSFCEGTHGMILRAAKKGRG